MLRKIAIIGANGFVGRRLFVRLVSLTYLGSLLKRDLFQDDALRTFAAHRTVEFDAGLPGTGDDAIFDTAARGRTAQDNPLVFGRKIKVVNRDILNGHAAEIGETGQRSVVGMIDDRDRACQRADRQVVERETQQVVAFLAGVGRSLAKIHRHRVRFAAGVFQDDANLFAGVPAFPACRPSYAP